MNFIKPEKRPAPMQRILETASRYPDRKAVELHDGPVSYRELAERAAAVSRSLQDLHDDSPYVAVMADKSLSCFTGILGILMAGKAYLPLNPRFPTARNLFMLQKAHIKTIIAGDNSDEELDNILENHHEGIFVVFPEGSSADLRYKTPDSRAPAYLLFTSGTTGVPKGVPVSTGNLSAYLDHMLNKYDFSPDDRFTQNFDLTFDLSVHDIFLAWSSGACLCVPQDSSSLALARFVKEKLPTVWFSVPSAVMLMDRMRLLKENAFASIRLSFFCGEALQHRTALAWRKAAPASRMVNLYGPTEATIAITGYEMEGPPGSWKNDLGIVSIGKVFDGNSILLTGDQETEKGELCLAGDQVTGGYFENEEADREAYFTDPSTRQTFYRTGDIVWQDEQGDLFYAGRKDSEVKISGYRVNLKEIENVAASLDGVDQAVAIFDPTEGSAGLIVVFVIASGQARIGTLDMDRFCRQRLPWYMTPGKFIFVDEIPYNRNGKIDIASLKKKYASGK